MEKRILITGGTGLIGKKLIKKLTEIDTNKVFATINNSNYIIADSYSSSKINFIETNLNKTNFIEKLPKDLDTIIHLAQSPYYKSFPNNVDDVFKINVKSTFELVEFARENNCKNFFFASSGSVYDNSIEGSMPLTEVSKLKINSSDIYTASKIAAESLISPYSKYLNVMIGRIFFPYGFEQNRKMFFSRIIDMVNNGEEIKIYGKKGLLFNPANVENVALSILKLVDRQRSILSNIVSQDFLSLVEYVEMIADIIQKKPNIRFEEQDNMQDFRAKSLYLKYPFSDKNYFHLRNFIKNYSDEFL